MTRAADIVAAIATAIDAISGVTMIRGRPIDFGDATPPCVWVSAGKISTVQGPELTGFECQITVDVIACPAVDGSTYQLREEAALTMFSAIHVAIQNSSTLQSLLTVMPIPATDLDIGAADSSGVVVVVATVDCRFMMDNGGGL